MKFPKSAKIGPPRPYGLSSARVRGTSALMNPNKSRPFVDTRDRIKKEFPSRKDRQPTAREMSNKNTIANLNKIREHYHDKAHGADSGNQGRFQAWSPQMSSGDSAMAAHKSIINTAIRNINEVRKINHAANFDWAMQFPSNRFGQANPFTKFRNPISNLPVKTPNNLPDYNKPLFSNSVATINNLTGDPNLAAEIMTPIVGQMYNERNLR